MKNGDTYEYMSPFFRAKPGSEASRLAGPASGRRKEYPERSRADPLTTTPETPPQPRDSGLSALPNDLEEEDGGGRGDVE
jgi:hypothetical protein